MTAPSPAAPAPGPRLRPAAAALAVAALAVLVHANGISNGFVWDDEHIIVENPDTRDPGALWRVLSSPDEAAAYYRPLTRASYLLDYQLWGLDPRGFHAVHVALHAASALLLFWIARRLLGSTAPALLAGALLAVHPIHTESVAFASARNNLLVLLFTLAALLLFLDADRRGSRGRAWASGLALLLGLLGKEQAVGVLPVLLVLALFPGPGWRLDPGRLRLLLPHAVAVAVYLGLRAAALGSPAGLGFGASLLAGLAGRLTLLLWSIPYDLGLLLFPRDLSVFHAPPASPLEAPWLVPAWVAIAAALALLLRRGGPGPVVGILWAGGQFLPVANLIPIPSAPLAERYLHVPAAGIWMVAAAAAAGPLRSPRWRPLALAGLAGLLALLGARTVVRNADWRDDVALFRSAAAVDPRSVEARFNLGVALRDRGDLGGAAREWQEGLRLDPGDGRCLAQLGTLAAQAGDLAGAEGYYRRSLASGQADPLTHFNLARVLDLTGRAREALAHYRAFVASGPSRGSQRQAAFTERRIRELDAGPMP